MQQQQSWSIQISPPTKIARTAYCDLIDSCDTIVWIRAAKERVQSPPQQQWLCLALGFSIAGDNERDVVL